MRDVPQVLTAVLGRQRGLASGLGRVAGGLVGGAGLVRVLQFFAAFCVLQLLRLRRRGPVGLGTIRENGQDGGAVEATEETGCRDFLDLFDGAELLEIPVRDDFQREAQGLGGDRDCVYRFFLMFSEDGE